MSKPFQELKKLSKDEVSSKVRESEKKFFDLKMKHVTGQLENSALLWQTRKEIARLKTYQSQLGQVAKGK